MFVGTEKVLKLAHNQITTKNVWGEVAKPFSSQKYS
jgi:hypothetical protein